jgi:hypothetical protein
MNLKIDDKLNQYMYDIIQKIIDTCGPRMPCSKQEFEAAQIIRDELSDRCDNVAMEEFWCHPRAFLGFIKIDIILVLLSFLLFFVSYIPIAAFWNQIAITMSLILMITALIIIWNEFFNYREFIDPLFKKKKSTNVIGILKSTEIHRKIVIFSGHHDSALQFNLLKYMKIGYPIIIFLGLIIMLLWATFMIFTFILSILGISFLFFSELLLTCIILFIIGIPAFVGLFFFVSFGEGANKVPGAVDNLSAIGIILGLMRFLSDNKEYIPPDVELRFISFGCEEAGLRGAYRYVEAHEGEFREYDVECINFDAIQSKDNISVINFEPSTRTRHSLEMAQKVIDAARQVNVPVKSNALGGSGILEKIIGQITGGTDATAFSKANIKATTITAMNLKAMMSFYHQDSDTLDKIEKGSLENVLKICIGLIQSYKNK